jgi:LmbE family N-acetylglucosaminyl deacetylase
MADFEAHRDARLLYDLRGLPGAATALHVGTHPDDEETGLLTYLARGRGVRTVYWSATRGEGGQNRIGPERGEALGVIRTWESLYACDINGADPRYGPFYDFGFSKAAEDSLAKWGHEHVVREIVRAIWTTMPQVVIARWSGGPEDGHGQHQAIGIATREAFDLAGDGDRFPELLELGLAPWQPLKLYHSMSGDWQPGEDAAFGARNPEHDAEGLLRIETGAFDPVAGRSFQEQAAMAWNRHRTQALAFLPEWQDFVLYYRLVESHVPSPQPEEDLFDGIDTSFAGLADHLGVVHPALRARLVEAQQHAELAVGAYHPLAREKAAGMLLEGLEALRQAAGLAVEAGGTTPGARPLARWLPGRIAAFERAVARLYGIDVACLLERARVTPGETLRVTAKVANRHGPPAEVRDIRLVTPEGWTCEAREALSLPIALDPGALARAELEVHVPATARSTTPYWSREPRTAYAYRWPDEERVGMPFDDPLLRVSCELEVAGHRLVLQAAGVRREGFPGGYRELPLTVRPAIAIDLREQRMLLPADPADRHVEVQVTARCLRPGGVTGTIAVEVPEGWSVQPQQVPLQLAAERDSVSLRFAVEVPGGAVGTHALRYRVTCGDASESVVLTPVRQLAPGMPGPADEGNCVAEVFLAAPAVVQLHLVDARFVRTLRYAYVQGADEDLASALAGLGLDLHLLTDEELSFGDLDRFDTIIVGPNAYLLRPAVRRNAARLLEHVARGGTLLVQYQAYGYAQTPGLAPYPFRYNQPHDRVTRPDALVRILEPEHPALASPNRIDLRDFEGWVYDRGLYFLGEWDRRYTPLLASSDPGEADRLGGLLVAPYGRGTYAYCAYSLFRQVPAGASGAARLLANLMGMSEARLLDRVARLRSVPLFAPMTEDELHRIARVVSEEWFDDGEHLARQGEPGRELYLVLEGTVEAVREVGDRWDVVYTARAGDVVGEVAPLAQQPRSASLRARGDTRVLLMRGEDLHALLDGNPELARDLLRILAQRLATTGLAP